MHVTSFVTMMEHLSKAMPAIQKLVFAAMYIGGIFMIYRGLHGLKVFGEMRTMMSNNAESKGPLILLALGACLMWFPHMVSVMMETFFAQSAPSPIHYPSGAGLLSTDGKEVFKAISAILQVVGFIAFGRGMFILGHLANQSSPPGTFGKAMMYMVGGILLINIYGTWQILTNTLGF
jgi:intracellular multiplication protein IcmC